MSTSADARKSKRDDATTSIGLASSLNATAQDWVKYIDGKFDEVSEELTEFKAATKARDAARAVLHQVHRSWDFTVKNKLEEVTGEQIEDPPPLDLPAP